MLYLIPYDLQNLYNTKFIKKYMQKIVGLITSRPVIVSNLCIKICKKNRWIGYVSAGDCVQLVYKNMQKKSLDWLCLGR